MYVDPACMAWLGMDGPVPGVMTEDYAPDAALCAAIVADGVALGVRTFHTDIEAPSDRMDTPAYDYFMTLGFRRPYTRTHWRTAPDRAQLTTLLVPPGPSALSPRF
jgi:copper homeostasis protein CutC